MILDIVTSIELTASAAILVAAASLILVGTTRARLGLAALLAAWFCVVCAVGASHLIGRLQSLGTPLVGLMVVAPVVAMCLAVARSPSLKASLAATPTRVLVALNILRVLGVSFLLLRNEGRVAWTFASVAGWGDIIAGVLAVPLAFYASANRQKARGLLWTWNTYGLLDLVAAVGLGVASSEGPLRLITGSASSAVMGTLPWLLIPGFLVPLLASSHLAIFWQLRRAGARDRTSPHSDYIPHGRPATSAPIAS